MRDELVDREMFANPKEAKRYWLRFKSLQVAYYRLPSLARLVEMRKAVHRATLNEHLRSSTSRDLQRVGVQLGA